MPKVSQQELDHLNNLVGANPQEALRLLRIYDQQFIDDGNLQANRGGFLIDIGIFLRDASLVQEGILSIQHVLSTNTSPTREIHLYNLANGYTALHSIAEQQPGYQYDPRVTPLLDAKRFYREAIRESKSKPYPDLHVNYGNCLAHLGRSLEAIDSYETALTQDPDHPMALGNLGMELLRFAFITQRSSILEEARALIVRALKEPRLENIGGPLARHPFEHSLEQVERLLRSVEPDEPVTAHKTQKLKTQYQRAYAYFGVEHHLFLNLCLRNRPCAHPAEDRLSLSITHDINDDRQYLRLVRVINEIHERYTIARLLLFEAYDHHYNPVPYEEMTHYTDNLDYAVYGVRVAKLKLAYESAFNVLDKVAYFLNDYLELGVPEQQVSITSIWRDRQGKGKQSNPDILHLSNNHFYGIYDIALDLDKDGYLSDLKQVRHYLTHRYILPHIEAMDRSDADGPEYHINYNEFFVMTIRLLQLVRSVVIYLVAGIDREERLRNQGKESTIVTMRAHSYVPWPFGPNSPL